MPLKVKKPEREGRKPFVYFKGSTEELLGVETEGLMKAFDETNPGLYKQLGQLDKLKTDILEKVRYLEERGLKSCLIPVKTSLGDVVLKMTLRPNGSVLIHQQPASHGLVSGRFDELKDILKNGFEGCTEPNVTTDTKRRRLSWAYGDPEGWKMTNMDEYSIELMTPMKGGEGFWTATTGFIKRSTPEEILCVNIEFAKGLTEEQTEARERFYKKELKDFRVPIHFIKPK